MKTLLELSRELAAMAQTGLTFTQDPYDKDRYTRIREIAGELLQVTDLTPPFRWPAEAGYTTPKVDVRGAIFRDDQVLLVKEIATGFWTLPGGWADVNLSPRENVERECQEETGYIVQATAITSIIDRERAGFPKNPHTVYKIFFLCKIVGGEAAASSETSHVEFFHLDRLPELDPDRVSLEEINRAYQRHSSTGESAAHFN